MSLYCFLNGYFLTLYNLSNTCTASEYSAFSLSLVIDKWLNYVPREVVDPMNICEVIDMKKLILMLLSLPSCICVKHHV